MRILFLNWRDPKHPRAGGAELFTYGIARWLVSNGDSVEWFSASFPGASAEEESDGVRFIRAGRQWTVHWQAFRRYHKNLRSRFDVVIDEVNTIPFFTPLWADVPATMLIHQLAREVWWYESPFPISVIGFVTEPLYLRCYRHANVVALSSSTAGDLRRLGFKGRITIVPAAVEPGSTGPSTKLETPTFLYVGRLAPSKRVDHIIRAFHGFRREYGAGQLWLIGDADNRFAKKLKALVHELGLGEAVRFLGRVSAHEKFLRMAEAHILLMASVREGWGLAISEAAACGTPSVVYDVPGLRDAVQHEKTGLVLPPYPLNMTDGMLRLVRNQELLHRLASAAVEQSRSLSFDNSATILRRAIVTSAGHNDMASAEPIVPSRERLGRR
jgi:glycosyltransferase involved in cell wall biosynthesis